MNTNRFVAETAVSNFLHSELDDYSQFKWKIEECEDLEDNKFEFYIDMPYNSVNFLVTVNGEEPDDATLEVCMYEDIYEEVDSYTWKVKYFWMLVKWS